MYSSFLLDIVNEADKANTLRMRADELDELRACSSSASADAAADSFSSATDGLAANTDLLSDHSAVISIRSSKDRAGEILSLNTAALRILGYEAIFDLNFWHRNSICFITYTRACFTGFQMRFLHSSCCHGQISTCLRTDWLQRFQNCAAAILHSS